MSHPQRLPQPAVGLLMLLLAGAAFGEQTFNQTRETTASPEVQIECLSGSLRIIGWGRDAIQITGTLDDDVEVDISGDRDEVDIEVGPQEWGRRRGPVDLDVDLEIHVPVGASIEIETVSASVDVSGVTGELEATSMSGDLQVAGSSGRVELETVSGKIDVEGKTSSTEAASVGGTIRLRGVGGRVQAGSVSGNIDVEGVNVERAEFESVSGSLQFAGSLSRNARLEVSSHSGNVTLELGDVAASFEVETFSGTVDNELGPPAERVSRHAPGRRLEFSTGDGAARITVETFSGNVRLRR